MRLLDSSQFTMASSTPQARPPKKLDRAKIERRTMRLSEDEVDLIDAARAARSKKPGKPFDEVLRKYGYSVDD